MFAQVGIENTGTYSCEATNSEGSAISNCSLTVIAKPRFAETLTDWPAVVPHSDLVMHVRVTGHPRPQVKWFKDNVQLEKSQKYKFDDRTLTISDVQESDKGEYTCEAANNLGKATASSNVDVLTKPHLKTGLIDVEVGSSLFLELQFSLRNCRNRFSKEKRVRL